MAADRPRVLIVDDHEVVGAGLTALLAPQYTVLGPIRDGGEVLAAVAGLAPDVVLLDISLPTRSGLDLLPDIREKHPRLPVVMLTGSADYITGRAALVLGALGFLPKDAGIDELELALQAVLHGKQYLSPRVPPPPDWARTGPLPGIVQQLTPRQVAILRGLGEVADHAELAARLKISTRTLNFHLQNIRRVLGIDNEEALLQAGRVLHLTSDRK
ncbi:MAG TPA: response regulator transcription factor [Gemmatimonadales bacterium]|nr:response regulator transcription factor [Gemmatimonadales bacterium]